MGARTVRGGEETWLWMVGCSQFGIAGEVLAFPPVRRLVKLLAACRRLTRSPIARREPSLQSKPAKMHVQQVSLEDEGTRMSGRG